MRALLVSLALCVACGGAEKSAEEPTSVIPSEPAAVTLPEAPDFTLTSVTGESVNLAALRGKTVVLEWFNPGCPFVKYAYGKGPLKDMAQTYSAKGVVWLAINSGAEGKQGADPAMNKQAMTDWNMAAQVLLDPSGDVGRMYGAKTTPHVWVIDPNGGIAYKGALDNAPLGEADGAYQNHVGNALDAVLAGKPVPVAETTSYGCSVKYGS